MSDYHGRIMNIAAVEPCNGRSGSDRVMNISYKEGHRDARHAAAEIANEADAALAAKDAEIARLHSGAVDMLNWKDRTIAEYKAERDQAQAEIARLRDALAPFAEISKHFNDGESGLIHGWHSTKVGSSEISVEHVHAARAAMAGGLENV